MSLPARVLVGVLGAGAVLSGAGTALAAPADGGLAPHPGGTSTGVLPGVAAPLPDPTLGVPEVLRVAITPLALLTDVEGAQGSAPSENGAQGTPGSTEV